MTNTYLPHVGGVARSVSMFAQELVKRGHDVLVVAPEYGTPASPDDEKIVERIPAIPNFNASDFVVRLPLTNLSERIRSFNADVIHVHHPFLFGETAMREAAIRNVPVIFTCHTKYEDYVYTLPAIGGRISARTMAKAYTAIFASRCDGVIAPAESIRQNLLRYGVRAPIEVVPTGIDVEGIAGADRHAFRKRIGIAPDSFVVGHVGRLAPEKNLRYLAQSVALFVRDEPSAVFLVVGAGREEETIRRAFAREEILDQLVFAGKLTGTDLYEAYRSMDVFAFASKSETQGLVIAEAMVAELPIVALEATGTSDALAGGGRGLRSLPLLPADASPGEFALALFRLWCSPELRKRIGIDCSRWAMEAYHWDTCVNQALGFYESVMKETRMRRLLILSGSRRRYLRWLRSMFEFAWQVWRVAQIVWTDYWHRRKLRMKRS